MEALPEPVCSATFECVYRYRTHVDPREHLLDTCLTGKITKKAQYGTSATTALKQNELHGTQVQFAAVGIELLVLDLKTIGFSHAQASSNWCGSSDFRLWPRCSPAARIGPSYVRHTVRMEVRVTAHLFSALASGPCIDCVFVGIPPPSVDG